MADEDRPILSEKQLEALIERATEIYDSGDIEGSISFLEKEGAFFIAYGVALRIGPERAKDVVVHAAVFAEKRGELERALELYGLLRTDGNSVENVYDLLGADENAAKNVERLSKLLGYEPP